MYILLECVSTQRTVTSKGYRLTISDVSWIPVQQELWPLNTVDSSTYNRSTSNGTQHVNTLPETNNSHLKMKVGRLVFPLGWPIFQGYVSFRESSRKRNHALAGCDNSRQTIVDRRSLAAVNFLENLPFLWKEFICCKQIKYTWNLNDLYFWRSTPQNKAFSNKNKGHLSSRYIYIYNIYIYMLTPPPHDPPQWWSIIVTKCMGTSPDHFLCQTNWISSKKQIKHKKQLKEIQKKYMN